VNDVDKEKPAALFLKFSRHKLLDEFWPRLRGAVESLTEDQVWWRPNENSNSIGNLMLHLEGNVRQWLITSFDQGEDARNRPAEFSRREGVPISTLIEQMGATLNEACDVLSRVTETELLTSFHVQGYQVTGLEAVYHVVEHFGMHYGQILYITKMLRDRDLAFYDELNQTGRLLENRRAE
jgi:uncharacterized damage-inducible protein DinB